MGVSVDMIAGFKTKDIIILEKEMTAASDNLIITTDDGSFGMHGCDGRPQKTDRGRRKIRYRGRDRPDPNDEICLPTDPRIRHQKRSSV